MLFIQSIALCLSLYLNLCITCLRAIIIISGNILSVLNLHNNLPSIFSNVNIRSLSLISIFDISSTNFNFLTVYGISGNIKRRLIVFINSLLLVLWILIPLYSCTTLFLYIVHIHKDNYHKSIH